jgi:hypothetical protein
VNGSLGSESGGILLLTALLMFFFVVLGSVAVDLGNFYVHKRHLQTQVDAAALAGGGLFGLCFSQPVDTAYAAMTNEANRYAGVGTGTPALALPNTQVGGANQGTITMRYQKQTYAAGGPTDLDVEEDVNSCLTEKLMFDVKGTEEDLPSLILNFGDKIVPFLNLDGPTSLGTVRAHARVELKKVIIFKGSLPLAVPEVRPRHVTATFVNAAGDVVSTFGLTGPTPSGSLNAWTGTGSVTVPSGAMLGVRIGVGQVAGVCGAANKSGGVGYVCYDYSSFTTGLVSIAGWSSAGTPESPARSSFELSPVTCSGSPFFSELAPLTGGATCSAAVQAKLHFSGDEEADPASVETFEATVRGPGGFSETRALTESGGEWSTGYSFEIPVDDGPYTISLDWEYEGGRKESFSTVQRFYSASDDSGPVKGVSLSSSAGNPYSLPSGTQTISVGVGLEGNLKLTPTDEMVMLRLTGGSRSSAVACDGPGADEFRDAIINGCTTPYQINEAGICPDPLPPPGAADCVPTQTGTTAGPTLQALDTRFSACPPYNWPTYPTGDPRVVPLMITDFSALGGSGTTDVPVTNFATFYVAGWTGSTCSTNEPPPFDVKKGAIWGHFVKYAEPDPNAATGATCNPDTVTPCVPKLTR